MHVSVHHWWLCFWHIWEAYFSAQLPFVTSYTVFDILSRSEFWPRSFCHYLTAVCLTFQLATVWVCPHYWISLVCEMVWTFDFLIPNLFHITRTKCWIHLPILKFLSHCWNMLRFLGFVETILCLISRGRASLSLKYHVDRTTRCWVMSHVTSIRYVPVWPLTCLH